MTEREQDDLGKDEESANLSKAFEELESASLLLDNNFIDDAVSCAYYSVFHAIVALLRRNNVNLDIHKHAYIIEQFQIRFVKTNILQKQILTKIQQIKKAREQSDYSAAAGTTPGKAARMLDDARSVVSQIQALLDEAPQ
jgi:uncharacterized protein (UPF0332 family)